MWGSRRPQGQRGAVVDGHHGPGGRLLLPPRPLYLSLPSEQKTLQTTEVKNTGERERE